MYYYIRTEPGLWTVGTGEGRDWHPDSDHGSREEAAARVHYLNGGTDAKLAARVAELERMNSILKEESKLNDVYFNGPDEDGQRIAELEAKNAELEAHIQQLANDIGHRHDAADAARQRIEDLEEELAALYKALATPMAEAAAEAQKTCYTCKHFRAGCPPSWQDPGGEDPYCKKGHFDGPFYDDGDDFVQANDCQDFQI